MKFLFWTSFQILLFTHPLSAQSQTPAESAIEKGAQAVQETVQDVAEKMGETRSRRLNSDYFLLVNYSPLDLLIPSKLGGTLGYIKDADKTWEFEYLKGSLSVPFIVEDLGKMTDERFSVIGRSYFGKNSFNLSYGITYFDFSLHLGDKLLSRVTNNNYPSLDLIELESFGFNAAFGNRWTFNKNITFGVDWISWAQPVLLTKKKSLFLDHANNSNDKSDVEKGIDIISYFPRFAFFKLQLGILF